MKINQPRTLFDALQNQAPSAEEAGAKSEASASAISSQRSRVKESPASGAGQFSNKQTPVSRHEVAGVSVKRKEDNFFLIIVVLLCFSACTGVAGYFFGHRQGYGSGVQDGVSRRSRDMMKMSVTSPGATPSALPSTPTRESVSAQPEILSPTERVQAVSRSGNLPTVPKKLEPEQVEATQPASKFTLQVQTFPRSGKAEMEDLLAALKADGQDAFISTRMSAVYVGHFNSIRSDEAREVKKKIQDFRWKKRNFGDCYFTNIPK